MGCGFFIFLEEALIRLSLELESQIYLTRQMSSDYWRSSYCFRRGKVCCLKGHISNDDCYCVNIKYSIHNVNNSVESNVQAGTKHQHSHLLSANSQTISSSVYTSAQSDGDGMKSGS